MEKLLIIRAKLQAYKVLADPNCRFIGEHLLPEVQAVIDEQIEFMAKIRKEWEDKYMNNIYTLGDSGKAIFYEKDGYQYCIGVQKTKIK